MEEYQNSDPNLTINADSSRQAALDSGRNVAGVAPSGRTYLPDPSSVGGRVEANTAFLKLGQNMTDVSGFENSPLVDGKSGITPAEDDDGGEAASARIAQEYRRQVRIKRLGEEIQQAEREKRREDEQRRKIETQLKPTGSSMRKKKEETTRLTSDEPAPSTVSPTVAPETESTIAKRRAEAMNAFKSAASGSKSSSGLVTALVCLLFIGALAGGAWVGLDWLAAQRKKQTAEENVQYTQSIKQAEKKVQQDIKIQIAREEELVRQKVLAEEAAKRIEAEKHALQVAMAREAEAQKALSEANAKRVAEERQRRLDNERELEREKEEKNALKKIVEDAKIAAQEKSKKKMEEDAKIEAAKLAGRLPDPVTPAPLTPSPVPPTPDVPLVGNVKTIPPDPPVLTDKMELPSGGVRLFVKASDPYGGKLTFQWRQLKGTPVEIADPAASKYLDGKWISQTYFVAKQPGNYEFEVTVRNDEGVGSTKKFPFEVLPPTTLK